MPNDIHHASAIVWLVALQFLLYATGWLLSSLLLRAERTAALCWGGFMACAGAGFLLTALRGEPRGWLAFNGSGIAFVAGLTLLWAGLAAFYGRPSLRREMLITATVLAVAIAALGPDLDRAAWRVLVTYAGSLWLTARIVSSLHEPIGAEHGRRAAWLIAIPGVVLAAAFAVPIARQLVQMDQPLELHKLDDVALRTLAVFFVAAALFNFAFMAMVTHRLQGRLRQLGERDALTGLHNRRAVERDLQREWRRWARRRERFAVLVLAPDPFKRLDHTLGHPAGDEVLAQVAQRLAAQARDVDVVARIGGEEFLLLLPGTTRDGAWRVGERLLAQLREQPVSVSIGATQVEAGDADTAAVLARADRALDRAKADGRDRMVFLP